MKVKTARRFLERNKLSLIKIKLDKGLTNSKNSLEKRAEEAMKVIAENNLKKV